MRRRQTAGFAFALGSMLTWGLVPVFAHRLTAEMDPLLFGGLSTLAGAAPFILRLAWKGALGGVFSERFRHQLGGIALFGIISTLLLFRGTSLTTGLNTGLLLQLEPFYSALLAALLLGEALRASQFLATLVMFAGAAFVIFRGRSGLNLGDLMIAATPCFQQLSHVITKKIIHKVPDKNVIPAARLLYTGIGVTLIAVVRSPGVLQQLADPRNVLAILLFGLVLRALDFFLWYQALERISLSRASATIPLSVAVSFAGSMLILGESVQLRHVVGLALILSGLLWLSFVHLKDESDVLTEDPI
jgi:drug/metabolite transporter (DMT)-like permease